MSNSSFAQTECQVICICGGYGFPLGNASAARITIVGKALQQAGIAFRLLHCGPSAVPINNQRSGVYEGIPFEYTTSVKRPDNSLSRMLVYIRAVAGLTARLARLRPDRRKTLVYLYVGDGPLNLYAGCLCRLLSIPLVQELCEWLPGEPTCSAFNRWLYRKPIFKLATGALVISKTIEQRVRQRSAELNAGLLIHRLPSIVDANRFAAPSSAPDGSVQTVPQFVYCGTWLKDVFFVIRAFTLVKLKGYACKLRIVGGWTDYSSTAILEQVKEKGLSPDDVVLTGCLDDRALVASYKTATALLVPLWDDDRSKTRLPNKLGEYLASGRPVVAGKIGDLTDFLVDDVNAYLAEPGNELDFAEKMISVLKDPRRAEQIGAAGQQACIAYLDYRAHTGKLAKFFVECVDRQGNSAFNLVHFRKPSPILLLPIHSLIRNAFCELLALGIIASGRARHGIDHALSANVITPIYFHRPNKRLFAACIHWLTDHGYTFVSVNDLADMLYLRKPVPKGAVWLSLDDGYKEWIEDVLPVVRQCKVPVTLFIPSGIVEDGGQFPWLHDRAFGDLDNITLLTRSAGRDALTVSELKRIARYPEVTIGGHTVNHTATVNLPEEKTRFEIGESKRILESWTGGCVQCFAYPVGLHDGREKSTLEEFGYRLAATTEDAFITPKTDPYQLPRFCVSDNISFPEAICNMVGAWRPALAPLKNLYRRLARRASLAPAPKPARGHL